ncbi:MAG: ROK family transcriptional regulator, partial [Microbacterium sp.]
MARRSAQPGSQSSLREANRARVIDSLKRHGRLTQVELAGSTGLSPATVSNIVKELTASGLLHTSFTSRSGRRATLVSLARQLGLVAGVHFSSRQLHIAIADATRTIVTQTSLPLALDHRHDAELDRLSILLGDMMESLGGSVADLLAIGLALPAPIDPRTRRVSTPGLLRGWEGVDVAESLTSRIGRPVYVDSEANLGGLAEAREGSSRTASSSVFIRVGHSISAGLVVGGDLFHGVNGKAGQIGHVTLDENGPICRCSNRGCLETYAGGPALLSLFPPSEGMQRIGDLLQAAEDGDGSSRRVIADAGRHIGVA